MSGDVINLIAKRLDALLTNCLTSRINKEMFIAKLSKIGSVIHKNILDNI